MNRFCLISALLRSSRLPWGGARLDAAQFSTRSFAYVHLVGNFFRTARKKGNNSPGSPKLTIEIRCDSPPCLTLMLDFAVLNTTTGRDGFRSTWRKLPGRWP